MDVSNDFQQSFLARSVSQTHVVRAFETDGLVSRDRQGGTFVAALGAMN